MVSAVCMGAVSLVPRLPRSMQDTVQRAQPEGVPPLELTGERTLPDVPAENYWFRRHLAVYEWVAERCHGREVVDMACGEGYGVEVLARRARRVTGVDANPEAHEHARLKYTRPGVRFVRDLVENHSEPCDAVVFLQTIEHVEDPEAVLRHFRDMLRPGGVAYVSTPNLLTLAPARGGEVGQPLAPEGVPRRGVPALCASVFTSVELLGLFHARMLRAHELALRAGWDRVHAALGMTKPFYDRFTPAISARDFALRTGPLERALDFVAVLRLRPAGGCPTAGAPGGGPARHGRRGTRRRLCSAPWAVVVAAVPAAAGDPHLRDLGGGRRGIALLVLLLSRTACSSARRCCSPHEARTPRPGTSACAPPRSGPTVGLDAAAFALMLGIELGFIELLGVDETESMSSASTAGWPGSPSPSRSSWWPRWPRRSSSARSSTAPCARGMRIWSASLLTGCVFALGAPSVLREPVLLLIIAAFGVGQCLLYERTGSLFAVIATHAAFNAVASIAIAPVPAVVVGLLMLLACVLVPRRAGPAPTPMPA